MSDSTSPPASDPEDPRVRFAAERTLLAWLRTAIGLIGLGFVVARFGIFLRGLAEARGGSNVHSTGLSLMLGTALVIMGVLLIILAGLQHWRIIQRLNRGLDFVPPRLSLGLVFSGLLAAVGILIVVYLLWVGT
jgi:putative membrane protein